ncbi:hypothetical protein PAENIP36_66340 [Paenibacillus sp. P36]
MRSGAGNIGAGFCIAVIVRDGKCHACPNGAGGDTYSRGHASGSYNSAGHTGAGGKQHAAAKRSGGDT